MDTEQEKIHLDQRVRFHVYDTAMREGSLPTIAETASSLSQPSEEVRASFQRLADGHILVLQKGSGEILMANPFSAVPTPFPVQAGKRSYYGNCIWDAMGVSAMLKQDATIETSCACCGTAMKIKIASGALQDAHGITHFAVQAAHWWDNVVFT